MALSKFNLILDLDNTLIASSEDDLPGNLLSTWVSYTDNNTEYCEFIYKRPSVDMLLDVSFRCFQAVSIWTASTRPRTMAILEDVFPGRAFANVFTREHCVLTEPGDISSMLKPLWSQGFQPDSTIIIDDNPQVVRDFLHNAWIVPRYRCGDLMDTSLYEIASQILEISSS